MVNLAGVADMTATMRAVVLDGPGPPDALRIRVDHVLTDDGAVAAQVRAIVPEGVEAALELVGTNTLPDTLRATAVHGVVCFTGMLSNQWTVSDFYPIDYIPSGVRLTAYGGEAPDLPADVLQGYLDAVAAGRLSVPIHRSYALDEIARAHCRHGVRTGDWQARRPPVTPATADGTGRSAGPGRARDRARL